VSQAKSCGRTAFGNKLSIQFHQHLGSNFAKMRRDEIRQIIAPIDRQMPFAKKASQLVRKKKLCKNVGEIDI